MNILSGFRHVSLIRCGNESYGTGSIKPLRQYTRAGMSEVHEYVLLQDKQPKLLLSLEIHGGACSGSRIMRGSGVAPYSRPWESHELDQPSLTAVRQYFKDEYGEINPDSPLN